ncbi:carbamoyltransferase C-terminal domain-containing protein [Aestuariivirga sp.]|uniref:carbamoyltransferase C-terminal domain-containing protein n=1 Tax=Aestuariivirga sp. TaxID=2650926 RepID=UPI0039E22A4F
MSGRSIILGVSAGHDGAASVLVDGRVAAHILRERQTGIRHHYGIDRDTVERALREAGVSAADVTQVAFTATQIVPGLVDDWDYLSFSAAESVSPDPSFQNVIAPGKSHLLRSIVRRGDRQPGWVKGFVEELQGFWRIPPETHRDWCMFMHLSPLVGPLLWQQPFTLAEMQARMAAFITAGVERAVMHMPLKVRLAGRELPGVFVNHHTCHAASTFYASPFDEATIITHDGGYGADAGMVFRGHGGRIEAVGPHYLDNGQFYDTVAEFLGLGLMGGAGKLMGLSGYGSGQLADAVPPGTEEDWARFAQSRLPGWTPQTDFFPELVTALRAAAERAGLDIRQLGNRHALPEPAANEIAAAAQAVVERSILAAARAVHGAFKTAGLLADSLCLSGGVALNCPANTLVHDEFGFSSVFIEPHCEDGGISLGAAQYLHHALMNNGRAADGKARLSSHAMMGPAHDVLAELAAASATGLTITPLEDWPADAARMLRDDRIIGIFQGRSENGPRALGHRSILANPSQGANWARVNVVKGREAWRPFAPAVLAHRLRDWFTRGPEASPFMLFTYTCPEDKRSRIPAVIHADGTSRVQTVEREDGALFSILEQFEALTGLPLVLNTSFNGPGQPIIETVEQALAMLRATALDAVYFGGEGRGVKVMK